uniref:Uncharacterized protein n=1 Tax=Anguilla anguilla TaxID=7936 RepID=A0A0E9Q9B9_ANGAN
MVVYPQWMSKCNIYLYFFMSDISVNLSWLTSLKDVQVTENYLVRVLAYTEMVPQRAIVSNISWFLLGSSLN